MADLFDIKLDLLKNEMENVQSHIRSYGQMQFTIKGWAITIFSAFTVFASEKDKPVFLGLCSITVILFWLLDASFKSIQKIYISRAEEIELFLQKKLVGGKQAFKDFPVPNTESKFKNRTCWERMKGVVCAGATGQLAILYLMMFVITGILAAIEYFM